MIRAAEADAAAIGEAGAGIMQALQRNSANLGKAPPPPGTCPICLESYSDASVEAGCGHRFCRECLRTWLKRTNRCPTCRRCAQRISPRRRRLASISARRGAAPTGRLWSLTRRHFTPRPPLVVGQSGPPRAVLATINTLAHRVG